MNVSDMSIWEYYFLVYGSLSSKIDSQKEALSAVDLIICIGGDGTLLYAVSLFEVHT